jgi:predicted nicotinamide N-methyase
MLSDSHLVAETIDLGDVSLGIRRPPDAEALISEEAFEREEFLPYWAELWPSGVALARHVTGMGVELAGARVLELGCGLGLPSIAAARAGAAVVATDWSVDALALLRDNAARNTVELELVEARWSDHRLFAGLGRFDLVLAADVLYEQRNVEEILALLPVVLAPGVRLLLCDPGRLHARAFLAGAAERGYVARISEETPAGLPRGAIHALEPPPSALPG